MEPEEFITQVARNIREILRQKGERGMEPKQSRGLLLGKGAATPLEIPPDIQSIHRLFQESFRTTYLRDEKIDNQNGSDFSKVAEGVLAILENSVARKPSGFGAGLSVGDSVKIKFDEAYNKILQLRDNFKQIQPSKPRVSGG